MNDDTTARTPAPVSPVARACPRCSAVSEVTGTFCPHCGASYVNQPRRGPGRKILISLAVALLIIALATGGLLKKRHDDQVRADKMAAQEAADRKALADAEAAAKEAADNAERTSRAELVSELEASITKDANEKIAEGLLDGPRVSETSCNPLGGGSTDDLTALTGEFECIAINKTETDGSSSGYRFSGTINYNADSWSWHLGS